MKVVHNINQVQVTATRRHRKFRWDRLAKLLLAIAIIASAPIAVRFAADAIDTAIGKEQNMYSTEAYFASNCTVNGYTVIIESDDNCVWNGGDSFDATGDSHAFIDYENKVVVVIEIPSDAYTVSFDGNGNLVAYGKDVMGEPCYSEIIFSE